MLRCDEVINVFVRFLFFLNYSLSLHTRQLSARLQSLAPNCPSMPYIVPESRIRHDERPDCRIDDQILLTRRLTDQ